MSDDTASTQDKHRGLIPWKPGQSGNPKGRAKGSRNKLTEAFLSDFLGAWDEHGKTALLEVAQKDPSTFVRVAASLMPKEMKVDHSVVDLTDEQLESRARQLAAALGISVGPSEGTDGFAGGEAAPSGSQSIN